MNKISKFIQLSHSHKLIFLRGWLLLGYVRILLLTLPFKYIAKLWLKPVSSVNFNYLTVDESITQAQVIGKLIAAAAKYTPWYSKCLAQSIACKIILRRFGIPNTIYIGVTKQDKKLTAHAWVTVHSHIINGYNQTDYTVMTHFSDE
ncbi:MAG: hypothetical protein QG673_283 [Pseudomonadota bacterium]|nr:hypothetical protein [Pseudomonadota bacterium]